MTPYDNLRLKRLKFLGEKYQSVLDTIEESLISGGTYSISQKDGPTRRVYLTLKTKPEPELLFFLGEFSWYSGVPMHVTTTQDSISIIVSEKHPNLEL